MKSFRIILTILIVSVLAGCISAGAGEASLVGKWGLMGTQMYEFTADGHFITGTPGDVTVTYLYSADADSGQYWTEGAPEAAADFTYEVTNTTLELTLGGMITFTLSRL